jgi:hypothetical protein
LLLLEDDFFFLLDFFVALGDEISMIHVQVQLYVDWMLSWIKWWNEKKWFVVVVVDWLIDSEWQREVSLSLWPDDAPILFNWSINNCYILYTFSVKVVVIIIISISPFAEIFKKEDRFFARGMGHWTKRRCVEVMSKFGSHRGASSHRGAAASSHRGASTPLAPQRPLFSRIFYSRIFILESRVSQSPHLFMGWLACARLYQIFSCVFCAAGSSSSGEFRWIFFRLFTQC